ncbi:MAG TPA: sigma-70 family RNA polymerase sigma factor [Solirubrobacterales bacterium]|nr:sigma-70 family RNA polymerase sigma factor [Solirubrobacterales bacterium]
MAAATMTTPIETTPEMAARPAEEDSRIWVQRLRATGADHDAAVAELHGLLLKAARFEVARREDVLSHLRGGDLEDLAQQSADDALIAVLRKLGEFRGESRFTTWAYKFALLEAAVKVRRRSWQGREIPLEEEAWSRLSDAAATAERRAQDGELFATLREEIERCLSPRQREVLVAVTLNDVPIDVLAERLGATRGALYKSLHDARRKLRAAVAERGFDPGANGKEEL